MPADFTWPVDVGAKRTVTPRVLKASFGDGYSQRVPDGLRTQLGSWKVSFSNRSQAEADAITDFFSEKGGHLSFSWIPPGKTNAISVYVPTWEKDVGKGNRWTVSTTFQEV